MAYPLPKPGEIWALMVPRGGDKTRYVKVEIVATNYSAVTGFHTVTVRNPRNAATLLAVTRERLRPVAVAKAQREKAQTAERVRKDTLTSRTNRFQVLQDAIMEATNASPAEITHQGYQLRIPFDVAEKLIARVRRGF